MIAIHRRPPTSTQNPDDLDLEPEEVPCPADRQINGSSGLGVFGVFLLVVFLIFVGGVAAVYVGAHFFMNPTYAPSYLHRVSLMGGGERRRG